MGQYKPPTTKRALSDESYHVFLSFRGPDVRKTLVDHLYEALTQAGLIVFLDSEKLERGEIIGLSIEKAIESSLVRIPIFSKGYADSVWCLREAAAMSRTPGLIIPLFYHMDPTIVRYPDKSSSPYYRSFRKHLRRYPREEISEWKSALHQICSFSGWSMDVTQGYEARLIKIVVNDLMKTLEGLSLEKKDDNNTDEKRDGEKSEEGEVKKNKGKVEGEERKDAAVIEEEKNDDEKVEDWEKNEFRNPRYVIEYVHLPQLFSDENPNFCSIM